MSRVLADMGETMSPDLIAAHKAHVPTSIPPWKERRPDGSVRTAKTELKQSEDVVEELGSSVEELRKEAVKVPATLRAPYFVLIHFLENLGSQEVKPADAIRAAVAISQISGNKTKQQFLLDFAEAAWAPGGSMRRTATETAAPPIPEELLPLLEGLNE